MKPTNKYPTSLLYVFLIILMTACSNHFKDYFQKDDLIEHYNEDLIEKSKNPKVFFTKNIELDEIRLIENSLIKLGHTRFESREIEAAEMAREFAKKIGASTVVIRDKFERTKKVYDEISSVYNVSPYYHSPPLVNQAIVMPQTYLVPNIKYEVNFDTGEEKVSIEKATQIWAIPPSERNYYAVRSGAEAVVYSTETEEREIEVHSYYASFWAKTKYPPALGVEVADISSSIKRKLDINHGVIVWGVFRDSPAAKAGMYRGDYLTSINDKPIISRLQMGDIIRENVGKEVKIDIIREEKRLSKYIKLRNTSF